MKSVLPGRRHEHQPQLARRLFRLIKPNPHRHPAAPHRRLPNQNARLNAPTPPEIGNAWPAACAYSPANRQTRHRTILVINHAGNGNRQGEGDDESESHWFVLFGKAIDCQLDIIVSARKTNWQACFGVAANAGNRQFIPHGYRFSRPRTPGQTSGWREFVAGLEPGGTIGPAGRRLEGGPDQSGDDLLRLAVKTEAGVAGRGGKTDGLLRGRGVGCGAETNRLPRAGAAPKCQAAVSRSQGPCQANRSR